MQTFTVIDNTPTEIVVDGDVSGVALLGQPYVGVYSFDNLIVVNGADLVTEDDCIALGTLDTTGGSVTCNNLTQMGP